MIKNTLYHYLGLSTAKSQAWGILLAKFHDYIIPYLHLSYPILYLFLKVGSLKSDNTSFWLHKIMTAQNYNVT